MKKDYVDCPQVAGKTVTTLRIHRDAGDGTDIQIDFTDGTSFYCCVSVDPAVEASLVRNGVGTPEVLERFDTN